MQIINFEDLFRVQMDSELRAVNFCLFTILISFQRAIL